MTRRSVLFSPGDRPDMMRKAPRAGADTIVFDLEDAVAPERKDEARTAVREVLSDPEFDPGAEVCLRVTDEAPRDLDAVLTGNGLDGGRGDAAVRLDAVMVPKVTHPDHVERVAAMLAERERPAPVLALVENAAGVLAAERIARADATAALVFGAEDLAADIGATRTDDGTEVLYAREHVVLAASAAGVDAIDTVYTDFEDEAGLREETEFALTIGYDGKMAIHPAQVPVINDAFTPDPESVEWARKVLDGYEEAKAEGRGVFHVEGEMIDAPLIARAERIVSRAEAARDE